MVKSTCYSPRGLELDSQHPSSGSQPFIAPVPATGHPLLASNKHQACTWFIDKHVGKISTRVK